METTREETIKRIKTALQKRSGKTWSVTGGRGTAWGWLLINAPPKRCTWHYALKLDASPAQLPEDYEERETGEPFGHMPLGDREQLATLLKLDKPAHFQGVSIPSSRDYWEEYIDRAEGRTPSKLGKQYWD